MLHNYASNSHSHIPAAFHNEFSMETDFLTLSLAFNLERTFQDRAIYSSDNCLFTSIMTNEIPLKLKNIFANVFGKCDKLISFSFCV